MSTIKMVYFAWVRERVGKGEEDITPPDDVRDVEGLLAWLVGQNDTYKHAFSDRTRLHVAVDQEYADLTTSLEGAHEIAVFPPVTGG